MKFRMLPSILIFFFASTLSLIFTAHAAPVKVVTSFSILADFVKVVGGDAVEVQAIVPLNSDPHIYEPTTADAKLIRKADIVFINGLGFEGWLTRLIEASGYKGSVIVATQLIEARQLLDKGEPAFDPHVWHDVANALLCVKVISKALVQICPSQAENIQKRTHEYEQRLKELDAWVKSQFESLAEEKRVVVTTHDAFWYYGKAYKVKFLAPVGISTEAEPSAASIAQLIKKIRQDHIKAVFIENLSKSQVLEQLAQETKISIGGTLYADSLSNEAVGAHTYIHMIKYNTHMLIKALMG